MGVACKCDPGQTKPTADLIAKSPLREIHCIGYCEHDEAAMAETRPVEEIIHYGLVLGDQLIEFIHEHHAGCPPWIWMVKLPL